VNRPLSAGAGTQYRITGYLKRGTHRYVAFGENGDDVPRYISVDLADCTVKSTSGVIGYNNYPVGNGWCRFEVTILRTDVCGGCKNVAHQFHLVQNSGDAMSASWTAAGTETVYAWGMGLQLSSSPPDYVATTSASATRGPECGAGTAPSQYNPHFCVPVYGARREIRTPGQIYGG
jgi:hypothetical protein